MKRIAVLCILVALSALAVAVSLHTITLLDGAFISFVYAKNCLGGHGLTYNGTTGQGFANPLWVLLISGPGFLGVDVPMAAIGLGCAAAVGAVAATYWLGRQLDLPPAVALIPVALLVLSVDFVIYAGRPAAISPARSRSGHRWQREARTEASAQNRRRPCGGSARRSDRGRLKVWVSSLIETGSAGLRLATGSETPLA